MIDEGKGIRFARLVIDLEDGALFRIKEIVLVDMPTMSKPMEKNAATGKERKLEAINPTAARKQSQKKMIATPRI